MRRREFVAVLGGMSAGRIAWSSSAVAASGVRRRLQRLLILGGTGFLGPHVVEAARRRGVSITLFNRGRTNPGLFQDTQGVEQVLGDRQLGLGALRGRTWDVVLDTSAHVPRLAREAAQLLRAAVSRYVYVSSTAVYRDRTRPIDEASPLVALPSPQDAGSERVTDVSFGPLKALCEAEVRRAFDERAWILRPGHLVGPHDPADRLTYWVARIARGGELIAPGLPGDPVQLLDVRDLAEWILDGAERSLGGTFNAVGPRSPLSMEALLETCRVAVRGHARVLWASAERLQQLGLSGKLPLWQPPHERGLAWVSGARAFAEGLHLRPLSSTARDCWQWLRSQPPERRQTLLGGLSPTEESQILASLRSRQAQR
ncbi:MAG: NAD-dependent epimerase/dehydratase family protein [Myxococcales bacterium]|nr:NAD-dependent epimerase/dehydratase family protein [Myxococcales bacterium]